MSIMDWVSKKAPEPVLSVLRPLYKLSVSIRSLFLVIADYLKIIGPDAIYDERYYAKRQRDPWRSDARNVAVAIREHFNPDSIIDFGCAIGAHLEPFYEEDIDIKGIEGNSTAFEYAVVPLDCLEQHDLRESYTTEHSHDVVLCFEVAEHLPKRFDDILVDTLVSSGDTIVMTAATPEQGGTHHINLQPHEYWCEKFRNRGMVYDSTSVENLRKAIDVQETTWITSNLMVFRPSNDHR